MFTCFTAGTSFVDGAVSINTGGKNSFVNSKLLVDTGALLPSGIAILEAFYFNNMGGNASMIKPSSLPNASGALVNSTMKTVGQVDVGRLKCLKFHFFFEGQAIILENLSLPVILGVNFLKYNSLSPILEPDTAQLVHIPSQQAQMLIANVSTENFQTNIHPSRSRPTSRKKRSNRLEISPPPIPLLNNILPPPSKIPSCASERDVY